MSEGLRPVTPEPLSSQLNALAADVEDVLLRFEGTDEDADALARVATDLARLALNA